MACRLHAAQDGYECGPTQNHKFTLNLFRCCSSVSISVSVFNVWPKTTLPLPAWPRDATRWDTSAKCGTQLPRRKWGLPPPIVTHREDVREPPWNDLLASVKASDNYRPSQHLTYNFMIQLSLKFLIHRFVRSRFGIILEAGYPNILFTAIRVISPTCTCRFKVEEVTVWYGQTPHAAW